MKVLIPIDFNSGTKHALRYADGFTKKLNIEIVLIHSLKGSEFSESEAKEKLHWLGKEYLLDDCKWSVIVGKANFSTLIQEIIDSDRVICVILGNPEINGNQRSFAKETIRLITHAETPFLIVPELYRLSNTLEHILVPVEAHHDDMRILEAVAGLGMPHGSKVHILSSWSNKTKDQNFQHQLIEVSESYMEEHGLKTSISYASDTKHFDTYLLDHAREIEADLIAIPHHGGKALARMLGNDFDQHVLLNKYHIPILTLDISNNFYFKDIRTLAK